MELLSYELMFEGGGMHYEIGIKKRFFKAGHFWIGVFILLVAVIGFQGAQDSFNFIISTVNAIFGIINLIVGIFVRE